MSKSQKATTPPIGRHAPMPGGKAKEFKKTMKTLLQYLMIFKPSMFAVVFFSFFSTVFATIGPMLIGKTIDGIKPPNIDFGYITHMIIWLVALYVAASLFFYLQNYITAGVAMKVTHRLRKDISEKLNRLPLKYFDTVSHGEMLSRVTNDVETVSQNLNQSLSQIISSAVTVVGVLIMMLWINLLMTVVALVVVPLTSWSVGQIVKRSQGYFKQQQKSLGELNGHIEEMYSGHNVVQAYTGEQDSAERFEEINNVMYASAWKSQFLSGLMMPFTHIIGNIGYVVVCILGGYLAVAGAITIGGIQAFIQYMRSFMQPITQLATVSTVLQSTAAAAERIFEFLDAEEEPSEEPSGISTDDLDGSVTFKNVHFGYSDKTVINNFSAEILPGQRVAIVGATGAGKTTIVKLLMRFYEINGGEIFIDGVSIADIEKPQLRSMFGMVLQDTWLYNASIADNIRYGSFDKTDSEVIASSKAAHCDEFIHTLHGGYNMILNEDTSNISQGQKQLLTIARVFLADPKILILDEATSSVDTRTEVIIQHAMSRLMKNRTCFVIAHRLSTIRNSDVILVMKDGDIAEHGTHAQLLSSGGVYAQMYYSG